MGSSRLTKVILACCAMIGCLLPTSDSQKTTDDNLKGITIRIKAGATFEESSVTATGQIVDIIANSERASFGIGSDADLKRAVGKYFGKEPNDAFLHSPTPWGDLYKTYGWPQVERVLQPKKAEILDVNTKPTIVATRTLTNKSNKTAIFTAKILEEVTNSVSNQWTNSNSVSVGQSINYGISFLGTGAGGETNFNFESNWGKSETISQQTTLGTETGVNVELKPGESAIVSLSASSGKMRVRITYEAHLTGVTAVNYNPTFNGHHFWGLRIGSVLSGSNKVQIVKNMDVGYFSDATVEVIDAKTNKKMKFFMAYHPNEPASE